MRNIARAALFRPRKDAITNAKRAAFAALHHPNTWRRLAFGFPMFGHGVNTIAFNIDDAQHRYLGHPAHFVKGTTGRGVYQALIGHIFEQSLERYLVCAVQAKFFGNLALSRRRRRGGDEF